MPNSITSATTGTPNLKGIIKKIPLFSKIADHDITIKALAGETNQNYLLSVNNKQYVLRLPQAVTDIFIHRDNEAYNTKICEDLSLTPHTIWREINHNQQTTGLSLSRYIANARVSLTRDFKDTDFLIKLASQLHLLQNSKKAFKGLRDVNSITQSLTDYFTLCTPEQKNFLENDYLKSLDLLKKTHCQRPAVPSHFDLTLENILIQNNRIWLIDWEYSAMSSPFWDIATVCNATDLDACAADNFLNLVIKTSSKRDAQCLRDYRIITKTLSHCWLAATHASRPAG